MGTSTQVVTTVKVRKSAGLDIVATESYSEGGWMSGGREWGPGSITALPGVDKMLGSFSAKPYEFLVAIMYVICFTVIYFPITFFDSSSDGWHAC